MACEQVKLFCVRSTRIIPSGRKLNREASFDLKSKLLRIIAMLTRMAMKFGGIWEPPSEYTLIVDCDYEHRDAEHEHEEEPEQGDGAEGLDRTFLTCARVDSPQSVNTAVRCRNQSVAESAAKVKRLPYGSTKIRLRVYDDEVASSGNRKLTANHQTNDETNVSKPLCHFNSWLDLLGLLGHSFCI